jgi:hypothetical protein
MADNPAFPPIKQASHRSLFKNHPPIYRDDCKHTHTYTHTEREREREREREIKYQYDFTT